MKKLQYLIVLLSLSTLFLMTSLCGWSQNEPSYTGNSEIRYFGENNLPISKDVFDQKKQGQGFLDIKGDSLNHRILVRRENQGVIENRPALDSVLFLATEQAIDPYKPLVIIYYPGKDSCNSTGMATRKSTRRWYDLMEKKANEKAASNFLYLYKDSTGLYGRNDGYKSWHEDPSRIIENMFFERHYPCSSFVVISEKGEYLSYFGGFSKELVWKAVKALTN